MRTRAFCMLIEAAMVECYGIENGSQFDTVPFANDDGQKTSGPQTCLGIFLNDAVHMASVAAQAMMFLAKNMDTSDEESIKRTHKDMEDFVMLMQLFRVAPYMQWTCIYFPGLTNLDDEIDLDSEDDPE